jgi:hypothetical protein
MNSVSPFPSNFDTQDSFLSHSKKASSSNREKKHRRRGPSPSANCRRGFCFEAVSPSSKRSQSDAKQHQRSRLGRRRKGDVSHKIRARVPDESCYARCRVDRGNSGIELSHAGAEVAGAGSRPDYAAIANAQCGKEIGRSHGCECCRGRRIQSLQRTVGLVRVRGRTWEDRRKKASQIRRRHIKRPVRRECDGPEKNARVPDERRYARSRDGIEVGRARHEHDFWDSKPQRPRLHETSQGPPMPSTLWPGDENPNAAPEGSAAIQPSYG